MAELRIVEFAREVRREVAKVTWPTRKETTVTTTMVFIMVILTAFFFLIVDQVLTHVIQFILGVGG